MDDGVKLRRRLRLLALGWEERARKIRAKPAPWDWPSKATENYGYGSVYAFETCSRELLQLMAKGDTDDEEVS